MSLTMYDAVTLTEIPRDAQAVAGYVNGRWPTYPKLAALFPHAHSLSIAVTAEADADCLDIEPGDASNAQAPVWFRRQKQLRPGHKPKLYTSLSNVMTLVGVLTAAGIHPDEYQIWSAHYTHTPHLCGPSCGYGLTFTVAATQYTDKALGKSLDASLVSDGFFPTPVVSRVTRRARLHAWIVGQRRRGRTWAWLKQQPKWRLWRRLGGK
jgi:hypothetical protein